VNLLRSRLSIQLRRTATWVLLIALVVIMAMVFASVGVVAQRGGTGVSGDAGLILVTFPGAYDQVLSFVLGLGGLFVVIFGASVAGSEWAWGTLKLAVTRGQRRASYMVVTFLAVAILTVFGFLLVYFTGVAAAFIGAMIGGVPTDGISDTAALSALPNKLVRGLVALSAEGAIGFAIATLARSQLAGIGVGIALYFGGTFLALFLPGIVKWLPFNAATAVVGGASGFGGGAGFTIQQLEPNVALVVVVFWLLAAIGLTAVYVERAEIAS
jgi:ABC-2 type transport system permease protein